MASHFEKRILLTRSAACVGLALGFLGGCSTAPSSASRPAEFSSALGAEDTSTASTMLNRAKLEDLILRYEGRFGSLVNDAFRPLRRSSSPEISRQANRLLLVYTSSSLDIALGAVPEQNLLDMVVFVALIREVFQTHWMPTVFKAQGEPVLAALDHAFDDVKKIARLYLSPAQVAELTRIVKQWHERNPDVISVETVRLADFSAEAGARAKEIENAASGLLGPISGATARADRALSLGERGLYYAQRAPFLIRMQSNLAVQDIMDENAPELAEVHELLDLSREMLTELAPMVYALKSSVDFASSDALPARIKAESRRFFITLMAAGMLLILFAGIVYVFSKLTYERLSLKRRDLAADDERKKAA